MTGREASSGIPVVGATCGAGRWITHPDPANPCHVPCQMAATQELPLLPCGADLPLCDEHASYLLNAVAAAYGL